MNRILVTGAGGMLGYAVAEYFEGKGYSVTAFTRQDFDIAVESIEKLEPAVETADVVINCAGVIKPRIEQTPVLDVLKVNGVFPLNLDKLCKKLGKKMFHVTTDCVYSGKKGDYTEDDYFDADDLYGVSKNLGEGADCMILRTSIIGPEKGQQRSLLEWVLSQKGKEVRGFTNHYWNGVTTLYLAEVIETILTTDLYRHGLFHIFSSAKVNKFELLSMIDEVFNLGLIIEPDNTQKPCDRSLASIYELSREIATKNLKEQLMEIRDFFKKDCAIRDSAVG